MSEFLAVGAGGFVGSCLRYAITRWMNHYTVVFPFGTLISNVIAGVLIGFIIGLEQQSLVLPSKVKLLLTTGLLGGLSTFSTFSIETVNLFKDGRHLSALLNITSNLVLCLLGVIIGMALAELLLKKA